MNTHFTRTIGSSLTPEQAFQVLLDVPAWWSGYFNEHFEGETKALNDVFSFIAGDGAHYSRQQLTELVPGVKIVWLVTDSRLSFLEKQDEWTGTRLVFDISREGDRTMVRFTHEGLTPEVECYDSCTPAWAQYLQGKLLPLLNPAQL